MGLNQERIGHTYPAPGSYQVAREKIREFAESIGDDNPAYRDAEHARGLGHPDVIAPPTFPVVITRASQIAAFTDPVLGVDFSRLVHGEQRFSYSRPIVAGDELSCTATIEAIRSVAGNDIMTMRNDIVDASGAAVVSAWATLVIRAPEGAS
jgi:acyl dehydratase